MYKHFTIYEREKLHILLNQKKTYREIAKELNKSPSTIQREVKRNLGEYSPSQAQKRAELIRKLTNKNNSKKNKSDWIVSYIEEKIMKDKWSPEQISGRLKLENRFSISAKTIYNWIEKGVFENAVYYKSYNFKRMLRRKGKKAKKSDYKRDTFKIKRHIKDRPDIINNRERIGDFEADTILGKQRKSCLVTLVDRKSRLLIVKKIEAKKSQLVEKTIKDMIKNKVVYTITPDRGSEFSKYEKIEKETGVVFYFTEGGSPWQKGTNENTNGLIREFIPKGKDITEYSEDYIKNIEDKINNRPRKCLGWKTPLEVYLENININEL